jgi:PrcB C-terminal
MMALVLLCALTDPGLPLTTVARGTLTSIDEPLQVIVRAEAEWQRLWARHGSGAPAPAVDFTKRMVVGVFLCTRPTAGYAVEIVGIIEAPDGLVVTYAETKPAPDRVVAQIITAPFHLVSCDRREGAVRFVPRALARTSGPAGV